ARSRPARSAAAQRIGLDLALVGLAGLAWFQLRQYSSPLAGANGRLGIDPLLAAAPTLGVLAGGVIALRLLPPATRFAERFVNRRPWTATMLGMWQAGRRPHAGPVLLLALAVGGSTLAWSLVTTWERSQVDQANHEVGADLRLVESDGAAPAGRAAQIAALPGVRQAVPGWRDDIRIGSDNVPATVVAVDAVAAADLVRLSDTLTDEPPRQLLDKLARARPQPAGVPVPAGAQRLTGTVRTPLIGGFFQPDITVNALFGTADGLVWRTPLPATPSTGEPRAFDVALPGAGDRELRFEGFELVGGPLAGTAYDLSVTGLRTVGADGTSQPVDLAAAGDWGAADGRGGSPVPAATASSADGGSVEVRYPAPRPTDFFDQVFVRYAVVRDTPVGAVPALVTPQVLDALDLKVGDRTPFQL
ncbi:ABC transporter permease, partial [Micromonospora echinofusca]|nr:ABC transporter permease [Micromonospora echinofusca]